MVENLKKSKWMWIALALLATAIAVVVLCLFLAPQGSVPTLAPIDVTPTSLAPDGKSIEPDTAFLLGGCESMTEAELRASLVLTPDVGYGLRLDTTAVPPVWVLTPAKAFAPTASFGLRMGLRGNDYTVAPHIVASSSYPRSGSVGVDVRTGVNLDFNLDKMSETVLKPAITVTPPLDFYIGYNGNQAVIYPNEAMQYGTAYTFTLSSDKLVHPSGYKLRQDYTFEFKTISLLGENMERLITLKAPDSYNSRTSEAPMLEVFFDEAVYNQDASPKLVVNLFSYPDAASYKRALVDGGANHSDGKGEYTFTATTEGLASYASFEVEPFRIDESGSHSRTGSMVPFPEALPEGRYLAELSYDTGEGYTVKRYKLIQSSDLSVYFVHTGDSMVVWANDAATGKPAADASFLLEGDANCPPTNTGSDGVATIKRASLGELVWGSTGAITLEWQGHTFVDSTAFSGNGANSSPSLDYTSTLFIDRPLYQSTDTVKVWGMVRPRRDDTPPPNLTLSLGEDTSLPITLDEGGFFTAELPIDSYRAGYYQVQLAVDDEQLTQLSLRVYDYIKPVYTATITTPQAVYLLDDEQNPPRVDINVSSFDGTPTPLWKGTLGQQWSQSDVTFANNGSITTDNDGNASVAVTSVAANDTASWYPREYIMTLRNSDAESDNYLSSAYLTVIPRDIMMIGRMKANGGTATVTVNTNRIDLTRVNAEAVDGVYPFENADPEELLRGEGVSTRVTAKLMSESYLKKQVGTSYDYINRVSVPRYDYERIETVEKEFVVTTDANGVAVIPDLPCVAEDKTYSLVLSAVDSKGRNISDTVYLSMSTPFYGRGDMYFYSLRKVIDTSKIVAENDGRSYVGEWRYRSTFTDNETVTFRLNNQDMPLDKMQGRILWTTVQTDFERVTVTDKDTVSLPFSEDLLPNYTLTGAYFDGKNVFPLQTTQMSFDEQSRALDIDVEGDSDTYHPGDKVDLAATVTEQKTGRPADNAEVVLAVVDEAIFALESQYVNPLGDIYESVFYPTLSIYTSDNGGSPESGAEKGGGGGETTIREKFPDTALFITAKTDKDGKASFSLTLPDSITSWRLTSLAVTGNGYAGNNAQNIYATKEFFVTPGVNSELLAGDSFTVALRGAGKGVATDDPVSYTVTVQGDGVTKTETVNTAGIRSYGWATFEGLAAGDYSVTVTGSCKDYTDGVKLPFTVLQSGIEMQRYETVNLADGIAIEPLRYPVSMTIYDKNRALYNEVLWSARSASYGIRADMQLGQIVTDELLNRASGDSNRYSTGTDLLIACMDANRMLKQFPHDAAPDMRLNAVALLVASDIIGYQDGSWHYSDNPQQHFELAAPGAFYLAKAIDGRYTKGSEADYDNMSLVDKLDLAIAYVLADDPSRAGKIYDTEVTPRLQKLTGVTGTVAYYLPEVGSSSSHDCTAAALRLAVMLHHPDTDSLMRYLLDRPSSYNPYILEKLLYLQQADKLPATAKVSYTLDGERHVADLGNQSLVSLSLSRNQLGALDIKVDAGEAMASLSYTATPDTADLANQKLTITKTVEPADDSQAYRVGDLVKVTLTPDIRAFATGIGDSQLIIDDYLPAGIKFSHYEPKYINNAVNWYLVSREGQRVRFEAWTGQGRMVPVVYYARNASPGKYIVEGALLTASEGSTWGSSERAALTIEP